MTTHLIPVTLVSPTGLAVWLEAHTGEILFAETQEHYWVTFCTEDGDWYASRPPETDENGDTVSQPAIVALKDLSLPLTLFFPSPAAPAPWASASFSDVKARLAAITDPCPANCPSYSCQLERDLRHVLAEHDRLAAHVATLAPR